MTRKIIHIDMDAFYASIEQRDNPDLKGKPIAVGRGKERGVVAAASYEARKYGVYSAMPSMMALRKCPGLIFVPHRFDVYHAVSLQIREILYEYTDRVEPLSLDEAYLDVTENKKDMKIASEIALEIKQKIKGATGLTASAGISYNKFLAKIASDYNKPDGFFVIKPRQAEKFVEQLAIEKFHGIGKVTAQKMKNLGIHTGADLKKLDKSFLIKTFGKAGAYFYDVSRGIDNRIVEPNRVRKSVGVERTMETDITALPDMEAELLKIEHMLFEDIEKGEYHGKTLTLKIKSHDFKNSSYSHTFPQPITTYEELHQGARLLLSKIDFTDKKVRLVGLTVSNFHTNESLQTQLDL